VTRLFIPETPIASANPKPESEVRINEEGDLIFGGKWINDPMTEKQKGMFILYGIELKEGLTKGDASSLIDAAKKSGVVPTEVNKIKCEKIFESINKEEEKKKLKQIAKNVSDLIRKIQKRKVSIEELNDIKQFLEDDYADIQDFIDSRITEIEEVEESNNEDPEEEEEYDDEDKD
jgi:hypothetical protein